MTQQPSLLIVGGESDPNTQRVIDQAHLRNIDYLFWNTDLFGCDQVAWDFNSPELDLGDMRIEPKSMFVRFNVFGEETDAHRNCMDTIQSYLQAWPQIRVLNRANMLDANNKSKNLRLARDAGFEIPNTTVLGNQAPLATLPNPNQRIIKPLNGGAHTQNVGDLLRQGADLQQLIPQFVQEYLSGENLRVFSIAGNLFCFHLSTNMVDYREDSKVEVTQVDLPACIIDPAQRLVRTLQFDYCALDFRCRLAFESPVFLEVNSFPMFVRFDDAGSNCLADAILGFLTGI